ncbi:hypothetical protein Q1695_003045 [Nippostrongylus brasiliensis]|nr:hypothetical protein Q1695_003045 [Nippostrongylus brasiliensis]
MMLLLYSSVCYVKEFPAPSRATWQRSADLFRSLWKYPRGAASIDGKHFKCVKLRNLLVGRIPRQQLLQQFAPVPSEMVREHVSRAQAMTKAQT